MIYLDFISKISYLDSKTIPIRIDKFPDGQLNLILPEIDRKYDIDCINYRFTCSDDIFIFIQLVDILQRQEIQVSTLRICYLLCARQDRVVNFNQPYSLKIIANIVNSLNAKSVEIVETHSSKTLELINNSKEISVLDSILYKHNLFTLCYPDKGAYLRYSTTFGLESIICSKKRNPENNELSEFEIINSPKIINKDVIMIDDLCDGGGTFCGLAPIVKNYIGKDHKLILIVTHAIQLAGIEKVAKVYNQVFISNSYKDWTEEILPSNVYVFDCITGSILNNH